MARWEFLQNLKNKLFIIVTFVSPLITLGLIGLVLWIANAARSSEQIIALVDHAGIRQEVETYLDHNGYRLQATQETESVLAKKLQKGEFDGILIVENDFFVTLSARYVPKPRSFFSAVMKGDSNIVAAPRPLTDALTRVALTHNLQGAGLNSPEVTRLTQGVQINVATSSESVQEQLSGGITLMVAFAVILLLQMITANSQTWILTSIMREKRNRIVEILLSSISANAMMSGKILGLGTLAFLQAAIWASVGLTVIFVSGPYWGLPTGAIAAAFLSFLAWDKVVLYLVYFVLGYFLLAALCAAVSATTSDDPASASQLNMALVFLPPILPLVLFSLVIEKPDHLALRLISLFPPATPGMMILRTSVGSVPWWEILLTLVLLAVSTWGMLRFAGKIFRTGILMYGKSAGFRELWRWARS
jgi:ABC-2 type transport system permease protein